MWHSLSNSVPNRHNTIQHRDNTQQRQRTTDNRSLPELSNTSHAAVLSVAEHQTEVSLHMIYNSNVNVPWAVFRAANRGTPPFVVEQYNASHACKIQKNYKVGARSHTTAVSRPREITYLLPGITVYSTWNVAVT